MTLLLSREGLLSNKIRVKSLVFLLICFDFTGFDERFSQKKKYFFYFSHV